MRRDGGRRRSTPSLVTVSCASAGPARLSETTPESTLIFSPAGFGEFFAEAAGATAEEAMVAIAAKYGMEIVR